LIEVGADAIASMLKVNTIMIKLCLHQTSISGSDIESIVLALHQNKSLQHLDLSDNDIDNEMFRIIVTMLKINKALKSLDLSGKYISCAGAKELACAFQHNIQLTNIYIHMNHIQNEGRTVLLSTLTDWNDILIQLTCNARQAIEDEEDDDDDDNNNNNIHCRMAKILKENALGTRVAPKKEERRRHNIYHWRIESWVIQKSVKVHHKRKVITKII
jgi:Ran GTPase-activating protein (RanGAP) involved in mRNA processing and transport